MREVYGFEDYGENYMLGNVYADCWGDIRENLVDHMSVTSKIVHAFSNYCSPDMDDMYNTIFTTGASMHLLELFEDGLYAVYGLITYRPDADVRVLSRKQAIMPKLSMQMHI